MRITDEQYDSMISEDRDPDVRFCIHGMATDHLCSPIEGMSNMFAVRMIGHKLPEYESDPDADPNLPVDDDDLMVIEIGMSEGIMKDVIQTLIEESIVQQECEARQTRKASTKDFKVKLPDTVVNTDDAMIMIREMFGNSAKKPVKPTKPDWMPHNVWKFLQGGGA